MHSVAWQAISNIIVFSGVVVAVVTIIYNLRTARKTLTAHFLFESRTDKEYRDALYVLRLTHQSGKSFRSYVFPPLNTFVTDEDVAERRKFQYILNFYERVAISIKEGIYYEKMIKSTSYTTVIETWDIAEPFIRAIREKVNSETIYQEFEWLVNRWKKAPLKPTKYY